MNGHNTDGALRVAYRFALSRASVAEGVQPFQKFAHTDQVGVDRFIQQFVQIAPQAQVGPAASLIFRRQAQDGAIVTPIDDPAEQFANMHAIDQG